MLALPALADEIHSDIEVGRTPGLQLSVIAPDEALLLEPAGGLINGWSAAEPGLLEIEGPEDGLLPLDAVGLSNTGLALELVSADAGFFFVAEGTLAVVDDPGESALLGVESGAIHSHPTWVIDADIVGAQFVGSVDATFRLIDTFGGYSASDPFTLTFTNLAPSPADLDGDGDVDDADFGVAFAAFTGPNNGPSSNPAADLDNDGDVDDADFGIAFAAFTGPGSAAAVPEPGSVAVLLGAMGLLIARRRRA